MNNSNIARAQKYFDRSEELQYSDQVSFAKDLESIVVIPCFDEDWATLSLTLQSLVIAAELSHDLHTVLIVFNCHKDNVSAIATNTATLTSFLEWKEQVQSACHFTSINVMFEVPKKSGVGYARKIGMDAAAKYFYHSNKENGIIICLDADTQVASNYFTEILNSFREGSLEAASIHFEHQLPDQIQFRSAIIDYELHLRYFIGMQRLYQLPFAYQTVGSAMACTAEAYVRVGGMVRRQAGEDFYFMQKFAKEGTLKELHSTIVYPSARVSHRVPFGTGKTIQQIEDHHFDELLTYHPDAFQVFGMLDDYLQGLYHQEDGSSSSSLLTYFRENGLESVVEQLRNQSKNVGDFKHRFFQWFNAFSLMKYLHHVHDGEFEKVNISVAIQNYFGSIHLTFSESAEENLLQLRGYDKSNARLPE